MSGPIGNAMFAVYLATLKFCLVQADTLASRSMDPGANYEEEEEPQPTGPRMGKNVLKSSALLKDRNAVEINHLQEMEKLPDESTLVHDLDEHDVGALSDDQQMDIYNKMKQEFGEDQMEVYAKMKTAQQKEEAGQQEAETPTGPTYSTKMRMTLKGYVHERVEEGAELTVEDVIPTELPSRVEINNDTIKETRTEDEDEGDEEHLKVFLPGQQAEWNNMIGTKGYKMQEKDWQLVNIVDKNVDKDGTTYGIQRGTMKVRVKVEQLRKPKKAAQKHDDVSGDHREVDHADAPHDLDHVDVMVPLAAPVGNRCLGKAKKLGKSWEETHTSSLECRQVCELKKDCHFVSFSEADGCNMYSKCKKTGGSGYRTWMKMRATPAEADRARQAELLEDKYMELWSVSKGLNKDKDGPIVADDSPVKVGSDEPVEISDVDLRPGVFSAWSSRLLGILVGIVVFGLVLTVFRMKMAARMNMKAVKDGKALDNFTVGGVVSWIQCEFTAVLSILQKVMSGDAEKNVGHPKDSQERYDVETNHQYPPDEKKEAIEPAAEAEKDAKALEVSESEDTGAADGIKPSIFKASQGYQKKLYSAPAGGNLKDEANASLKSLMGGSFKN